ncbi:MAG: aspartate carbamoyltransferase [Patescibacteria group bacterium]
MPSLQHVLSVRQFDKPRIDRLFARVREMRGNVKRGQCSILGNRLMASLFYEPSTRTRLSFEAAMLTLGGAVVGTESAGHFSSVTKGESLEDTVCVIGGYVQVIVLRHPERGSAERAASVSNVPIINAGDGDGEHPTQALLDLFTIEESFKDIGRIHVVFVGDLKNGRTVHSLARLLAMYDTRMSFVSPDSLRLPDNLFQEFVAAGCEVREHGTLDEPVDEADVIYMTRVQKERQAKGGCVAGDGSDYALTHDLVAHMKKTAVIMHPLPRNSEIPTWFDADPRAAYFRQAKNGLYVRMALLEELLNPFPE